MKKRKPFAYISILGILSVLLGAMTRSWVFFVGAISSLSVFVIAAWTLPHEEIDVTVSRGATEREVYVGDEVEVTLEIKNEGERIRFLEVHDVLPAVVKLKEGLNHQILELDKDEKIQMKYKISCPVTGKINPGPIKMRFHDSLNLCLKEMKSEEEMTIRVLPRSEEMQSIDIEPSYTKHWLGEIKSKNMGVGSEFFSLREYHPGDQFRDINWKATAKQLDPITNAYEGEKSGDVILVVDGYEKGIVGNFKNNTLEASINAAGTLASNLLSARNRVGLVLMGDYLNWVYPRTGKNQLHRIMDNLTKLETGGSWELQGVKWLLKNFFPRKCMIIFISPLTVPEFSETIIDLCMEEYDVMVLSPDPIKIEKEIAENFDEDYQVAEKLSEVERSNTLEKLWKYGLVVDWDPTQPLEPTLEEVIRYRKKLRRV